MSAYLGDACARAAVAVPLNGASPSHELARELDDRRRPRSWSRRRSTPTSRAARCVAVPRTASIGARARRRGRAARGELVAPVARGADDLAVLLFTAGTAGAPKPAMLTHGSLLANLEQMQAHPGPARRRRRRRARRAAVLPRVRPQRRARSRVASRARRSRSSTTSIRPRRSTRVRADGVTVVAGGAGDLRRRGSRSTTTPRRADAFARVRLVRLGRGRAPGRRRRRRCATRFGVDVHDGYGLTEASPVVTTSAVAARAARRVDRSAAPGRRGAARRRRRSRRARGRSGRDPRARPERVRGLLGRSPTRPRGARATAGCTPATSRVADDDGWLTLVERAKDVIIVSGFNVYPGEVEDALADASRRRRRRGDRRAASAHGRDGRRVRRRRRRARNPDPVELLRHAGRRLARYKLPTRVELVDELPRSFAGKLLRRELVVAADERDARLARPTTPRRSPRRSPRSRPRARARTPRRDRRCPAAVRRSTARACRARSARCRPRAGPIPGARERAKRTADHAAPTNTTTAPTPLADAGERARQRVEVVLADRDAASAAIVPWIGATSITPIASPVNNERARSRTRSPMRRPHEQVDGAEREPRHVERSRRAGRRPGTCPRPSRSTRRSRARPRRGRTARGRTVQAALVGRLGPGPAHRRSPGRTGSRSAVARKARPATMGAPSVRRRDAPRHTLRIAVHKVGTLQSRTRRRRAGRQAAGRTTWVGRHCTTPDPRGDGRPPAALLPGAARDRRAPGRRRSRRSAWPSSPA